MSLEPVPRSERGPRGRNAHHRPNDWSVLAALDFTSTGAAFRQGPRGNVRSVAIFCLLAHVIDQLIVTSVTCFVLAFALYLNRGRNFLLAEQTGWQVILMLAVIVDLSGLTLMMTIPRLFLGCTPGEWTFGLRLGSAEQRHSASYVRAVLKRFFVCSMTGGITLVVFSIVSGTDLAGRLSRVPIVQNAK